MMENFGSYRRNCIWHSLLRKKSMRVSNHASGVSYSTVPTFVQETATFVCGKFRPGDAIHFSGYSMIKLRRSEYVSA
jgi:hypothetical protein